MIVNTQAMSSALMVAYVTQVEMCVLWNQSIHPITAHVPQLQSFMKLKSTTVNQWYDCECPGYELCFDGSLYIMYNIRCWYKWHTLECPAMVMGYESRYVGMQGGWTSYMRTW